MLTTSRTSLGPRIQIDHRDGDKPTDPLLTQVNVEEVWSTNLDGAAICTGLRVWLVRGERDERVELVLP